MHNRKDFFKEFFELDEFTNGNLINLYMDGDTSFYKMINAIDEAKKEVWIETYKMKEDNVGNLIKNSLIKASLRGVRVILIYDSLGSANLLSRKFLNLLKKSGVKIISFNPILLSKKNFLFFRNHKKILLIDQKHAFCGGLNITDEYAGYNLGNNKFRDTLIELKGPVVFDLCSSFLSSINETDKKIKLIKRFFYKKYPEGVFAQVLNSNSKKNIYNIKAMLEILLKKSVKNCYLISPYFLPFKSLKNEIIYAAKRGVDVRIITGKNSDIPIMRRASRHAYGEFLAVNIKIYEYFDQLLHSKIITVDGIYSSIGSFNLNKWSAYRNLEVNIGIIDSVIAKDFENQFIDDLKKSKEINLLAWQKRNPISKLIDWISYNIMYF
jgi:cardiolipin synthase